MTTFEQIIITVFAGLSPLLFSFVFKIIEGKNESSIRKKAYNEAQDRIKLVNTYFDTQSKLLDEQEIKILKANLAKELADAKQKVNDVFDKEPEEGVVKLNLNDRLFLMFIPNTFLGWIWNILFYILGLVNILTLIILLPDNNSNITISSISNFFQNIFYVGSFSILFAIMLAFRHLGISNYRRSIEQK